MENNKINSDKNMYKCGLGETESELLRSICLMASRYCLGDSISSEIDEKERERWSRACWDYFYSKNDE